MNKNESEDAYIIPNPIDNPVFDVNTDEKDYSERIYLDKNKMKNKDKLSSIFKTIEINKPEVSGYGVYDYLLDIEDLEQNYKFYNKYKFKIVYLYHNHIGQICLI